MGNLTYLSCIPENFHAWLTLRFFNKYVLYSEVGGRKGKTELNDHQACNRILSFYLSRSSIDIICHEIKALISCLCQSGPNNTDFH